jgi:hypothetical protein
VPIAALGRIEVEHEDERLTLDALVAETSGRRLIRDRVSGPADRGEELGDRLARQLIAAGARDLLPKVGGPSYAAAASLSPRHHDRGGPGGRRSCARARELRRRGDLLPDD